MSLRLPTLSLFTIAFLLSPLQRVGVAQTAQNSNSSQQTQSTPDRSRGNTADRKAEADRLSQQGGQQYQFSQFQAAM